MDNNKRYLIIFGIFALVIVTSVASFAFFTYSRVGNTSTTITSGDIEFTYKEGDNASLSNAFPVSDSVGAQDSGEEYTFTVNLKSTSSANKMNYNVYLLDDNNEENTNYFNNEQIKFALIKDGAFVAGTSKDSGLLLSDLVGFDEGEYTGEGLVLENQEIVSGKTDEYKLRIWISDDVNYSNTSEVLDGTDVNNDSQTSNGKYNGYKYSLKVKVTSEIVKNNNSPLINNLTTNDLTITANLSDVNGLSAYAINKNSDSPSIDSEEWIDITNETARNNIIRTSNELITNKTISYTLDDNGTYYLHVKNKLNQVSMMEFVVNVDENIVYDYQYRGYSEKFTAAYTGNYKIELWGASGGDIGPYIGGNGGYTSGNINLKKGTELHVYVGGGASTTSLLGGYNGGGDITDGQLTLGRAGGGATDIRINDGVWSDFNSLKSRIMVASGGGGANYRTSNLGEGNGGAGGGLIGTSGISINNSSGYGYGYGTGGEQSKGGVQIYIGGTCSVANGCNTQQAIDSNKGFFGYGGNATRFNQVSQTGGGSGYYGGGGSGHGGAGGGSSYISGHNGCDAISEDSTSDSIIHTGQSNHYSGYIFTDTVMIDGAGYDWTTEKGEYVGMPSYIDESTIAGNDGNGFARITYIGE